MKTFILLGSTMGFVYLSDKTDEAEWLLPGEGTMPVESLLIKLRDIGYQGDFSLSVNPESLSAWGIEHDIVTKLISVRVFLAKYFG
jgi:sugar phosphate isomerase/epimerase